MTYQPHLVANFSSGLERRLQPWLSQDDAQQELFDGYVYRGVLSKRNGYSYYATGEMGGAPYRESRIVHAITALAMTGAINSVNRTYTTTVVGNLPIARGSFSVAGNTPAQTLTDNGHGYFLYTALNITAITQASPAAVTTSVNHGYTTGDQVVISGVGGMVEIISNVPYTITVTGLNTFTLDGIDSSNYNAYSSGGTVAKVSGTINYRTGVVSVIFATPPTGGTVLASFSFYPGNPVMMVANYFTATNVRELIVADTRYVNKYNISTNTLVDISPASAYTGDKYDFFSWVNYPTAADANRLLFSNNTDVIQSYDGTTVVNWAYTPTVLFTTLTCLLMFSFKDRLVLLRTTEDSTVFPRRIRITGTGQNCDVFDSTAAGAGFIDIPDNSWIMGAAFNRDDLLIFTDNSTWVLKYTGNDTVPFTLNKLDESRGSGAPFAAITYLNRTSAASPRGLIISDGYRVDRQDEEIPDFSFQEIDGDNFALCFAGSVDTDRDHYLIYPPAGSVKSERILVTNYDEDNYSVYRQPMSSMGTYVTTSDVTWNDLIKYDNWQEFANDYGDWYSFAYSTGAPFSIGGGHKGEIWKLNIGLEDNPVNIRNITVVDATTVQVTTDWNNFSLNAQDPAMGVDTIYISGVTGMTQMNDQQYPIIAITDNYTFNLKVDSTANYSAFTAQQTGEAARVIPFDSLFKQFNPYINQDKKVRCGWLYMYVSASDTKLQRKVAISDASQDNPCVITTQIAHGIQDGSQVTITGVAGMTELNNKTFNVTVLTSTSFELNGIDSTAYAAYTSSGLVGVPEKCKAIIQIITNDNDQATQSDYLVQDNYQGTISNLEFETGSKKWYKVYINQVGNFIQFRVKNLQAGAKIDIHAIMPGFQPVGRII